MNYVLLKDYLTNDGVTVPKDTVLEYGNVRGTECYTATIRKYKDGKVGEVSTKLHLPKERVESNPDWFKPVGYWYIDDVGAVLFSNINEHNRKLRKAFGNYFESELQAKVRAEAIRLFLTQDCGLFGRKEVINSGKCTKPIAQEGDAPSTGTYDKAMAKTPSSEVTYDKAIAKTPSSEAEVRTRKIWEDFNRFNKYWADKHSPKAQIKQLQDAISPQYLEFFIFDVEG